MNEPAIVTVAGVDCTLDTADWDFADREAVEIDAHWRARTAQTPELFNGAVLLLRDGEVVSDAEGRRFRGVCFETEFRAFMAWREFGFPPSSARNIFSMAALETADGAFILGEMAPHTAPAGQVYFPSGTPDRGDVHDGIVDLDRSALRELGEETGLHAGDVAPEAGMDLVLDAHRVCCMKRIRSPHGATALVEGIHGWLARQLKPELARMHVVRTVRDLQPAMPDFVAHYIRYRLDAR